ncbi:MAG: nickel pincer cofactor biosynthesis protein LarB [Lachnospiraceae bacterium]|nr:nickel pincer cofactor biosynthesis protein LarB [Lachnospiraceae bacterium]
MDRNIELGFANIDLERRERTGIAEVVYGEGKSAEQIVQIVRKMYEHGEEHVLITRVDGEKARIINRELEAVDIISNTYGDARIVVAGGDHSPDGVGRIAVVTGGTSDIPVAEEAARTAEFLGNEVDRVYDVGVAGLHRLMSKVDIIRSATVVIAIAGMEGALASVVGGLVSAPVIAVPTSVGYGANFGGLSALLAMLNSCASGVSVVNIDNGFGAGYQASLINHTGKKQR